MSLNPEQIKLQQELKKQADARERFNNELPENIGATWSKLVGYMREHYYMDELWDGRELAFCRDGEKEALVKIALSPDKILVSMSGNEAEQVSFELTTTETADEVIQALKAKRLPNRVLPTDNVRISSGGGRCDLCLINSENVENQDRRAEMSLAFTKCYGDAIDFTSILCNGKCGTPDESCLIIDIGSGGPGLTADEVTHILFPYWWTKSSIKKENEHGPNPGAN